MDRKVLGANLIKMRKALKMSQEYVAGATGIKQYNISNLESGSGGGLDALIILLNYFGKYFDLNGYLNEGFIPVEYGEANPSSNVFEMREKLNKVITELQDIVDGPKKK